MRAVVTGGAGFIGSHVVEALLARGDEVHVVDNLATGRRENLERARRLHELDIREPLDELFDEVRPEIVFHLAAQADVGTSVERPRPRRRGERARDAERARGGARPTVPQVVFSSTGGAIYGECERPAREERPARPVSPYGTSKLAAEEYLATLEPAPRERDTSRSASRTSTGRGSSAKLEGGVVAIFIDRLRAGEKVHDLRRRRADARLRLRRRRRRGGARGDRRGRRRLQRRHRRGDVGARALRLVPREWPASRPRPSTRPRGPGDALPQRARRLARRARARLAAADLARAGPARDLEHRRR